MTRFFREVRDSFLEFQMTIWSSGWWLKFCSAHFERRQSPSSISVLQTPLSRCNLCVFWKFWIRKMVSSRRELGPVQNIKMNLSEFGHPTQMTQLWHPTQITHFSWHPTQISRFWHPTQILTPYTLPSSQVFLPFATKKPDYAVLATQSVNFSCGHESFA